jgi:hypothetical protein
MKHIRSFNESTDYYKDLLEKQRRLIGQFDFLLSQYREYQRYFDNRTPEEAESRYYSDMVDESGYESEGLYHLEHKSLKSRMLENRQKRNKISKQLIEIKKLLKIQNQ